MDFDTFKATNPDNKYDDGEKPRFILLSTMDDMVINLIGRGVGVGTHEVLPGTVQPQHEDRVGKLDYLFMLDGGGHAWMHEVDDYRYETRPDDYDRLVGTRRVIKHQPSHSVSMTI